MVLKCPECGAQHEITFGSKRISSNLLGEFFIVCGKETTWNLTEKFPPQKKSSCNGYMVVDMEKLKAEEESKKEK